MAELRQSDLTGLIEGAIELIDATFEALSPSRHWCEGAWATDAARQPIGGSVLEAVESEQVAARCLFGELLHQGLCRGDRITVIANGQAAIQIDEAPPSLLAAAETLHIAWAAIELLEETFTVPPVVPVDRADRARSDRGPTTIRCDEPGSHEETVWTLLLAGDMLRDELDASAGNGPR